MAKGNIAGELLITTAKAGELVELTATRIRQLIASGHIEKRGKDQVPLVSAVRGVIRFWREKATDNSRTASENRVRDERARELQLKNAERDGRLVDLNEARETFQEILGALRSRLDGVGKRHARDQAQRRQIEQDIDAIFGKAAAEFRQKASVLAGRGRAADAETGDDAG